MRCSQDQAQGGEENSEKFIKKNRVPQPYGLPNDGTVDVQHNQSYRGMVDNLNSVRTIRKN